MSLARPHPLWTTCNDNSFEVNKAYVVANLLSGRYPTDWLSRNWSSDNPNGHCILCPGQDIPGTLEHMLVSCDALASKRSILTDYFHKKTAENNDLRSLAKDVMMSSNPKTVVQFLLDPSVMPAVITATQNNKFTLSEVFTLTRTYCYAIHRRRLQLTGKFKML